MRRHIGVAPAWPPEPVDAEARHLEERNFAHLARLRDVMDRQAAAERFALGDAVGEAVFEIAALIAVGLHGDDVGAVGQQHQVIGYLQMMRAGILPGGDEVDRLQFARIGGVENGHAVAEHMPDIEVFPVDHHLHAVRAPADVAVGKMLDAVADAFERHSGALRGRRRRKSGDGCKSEHALQLRAAADLRHGIPPRRVGVFSGSSRTATVPLHHVTGKHVAGDRSWLKASRSSRLPPWPPRLKLRRIDRYGQGECACAR